ncbi:hypothetical protein BH23BAC3_BH23BAC3_14790 [soil metagenome]
MRDFRILLLILTAGLVFHACASSEKSTHQSSQEIEMNSEGDEKEDVRSISPRNSAITLSNYLSRVPGLHVQNRGGLTEVRIRGVNTLQGNVHPLFVINGSHIGHSFEAAEQSVSVDDIDYITVLRGNDATQRYGSRGSAGVVEIYTKK